MAFGTLTTLDPLVLFPGSVLDFGEDAAYQAVANTMEAHNRIVNEMLTAFIVPTEEPILGWGISVDDTAMDELDEFGTPSPSKTTGGQNVGFPFRKYGAALQWTRDWLQNTSANHFAQTVNGIMIKDLKTIQREFKKALFLPTNYTWTDRFVSDTRNLTIGVKRLVNGDSGSIPNGPNAEVYDGSTHTHYLGSATLTNAALASAVEHVIEHYTEGSAVININRAQESTVMGLTDFKAYPDPRVTYGSASTLGRGVLDNNQLYNRAIGVFRGAEVRVKPWMISGYVHCWMEGAPAPLKMRRRKGGSADLRLVADVDAHPLRARQYVREMGLGVHERTNGVCLYIGGGSYVAPSIT